VRNNRIFAFYLAFGKRRSSPAGNAEGGSLMHGEAHAHGKLPKPNLRRVGRVDRNDGHAVLLCPALHCRLKRRIGKRRKFLVQGTTFHLAFLGLEIQILDDNRGFVFNGGFDEARHNTIDFRLSLFAGITVLEIKLYVIRVLQIPI